MGLAAAGPETGRRSLVTRFKMALAARLPRPVLRVWRGFKLGLNTVLPKGLFARSLLIIVLPVLILQTVLTVVFLDRHWELTTRRLSAGTVRDMAAVVDLMKALPGGSERNFLLKLAADRMELKVTVLPGSQLQPEMPSVFDLLKSALHEEIAARMHVPASISNISDWEVEVRLLVGRDTLAFTVQRENAYASNWHIFLVWMVTTSIALMLVSVLFLRNQIRPIERLANAMERFGKGQPAPQFHAAGAREVRRAAFAFTEMRRRIERQVEQRTTMLAGVSHDMRTILTRFRLELAFLGDEPEAEAMRRDADEMEAMLEAYIAFAKGDADEARSMVDVSQLLSEVVQNARRSGVDISFSFTGQPVLSVRPGGFRRLTGNLVGNAARYGSRVAVAAVHEGSYLVVTVDDDGPGIPLHSREDVFRPFFRLDSARNQDQGGTGLGLAIVRDVARVHGGDAWLEDSPLGGCRAVVRIPG